MTFIRPGLSWLLCYPLGLGLFGVWMGLVGDQFMRFLLGYIRMKQGKWLKNQDLRTEKNPCAAAP